MRFCIDSVCVVAPTWCSDTIIRGLGLHVGAHGLPTLNPNEHFQPSQHDELPRTVTSYVEDWIVPSLSSELAHATAEEDMPALGGSSGGV